MPVKKAACPNCGEVANITVSSKEDEIRKVSSSSSPAGAKSSTKYESACKECGKTIYYWLN
jgi:predicted RNA-binding Zn-ribbon protein involved in translation (DUF1610 family)